MSPRRITTQGYLGALKVGWFLALRNIRRSSKATTALIVFIMMLTFLNLVVVSGLLVGLIIGSFQQFRESYSGEVIITPASGKNHIEHSQELVTYLKHHAHVTSLSKRHTLTAQVSGSLTELPQKNESPNRVAARLVGIDVEAEEEVTRFSRSVAYGEPLKPNDTGYILIGANLLRNYSSFADANIPGLELLRDVDVGSRIKVTATQPSGERVSKDFIVKGIVKSKVDEVSIRMFMIDKELRRMMPINANEVQEIAVRTNPMLAKSVVEDTKAFMGDYQARVQTSDEAIPSFLRDVEATFEVLGNALSSIALVVASITIFIVVFINAVTRRKFIGIMKAIGISPRAILVAYVVQALFYGVIGSLLGLLLTFGVLKPYFDANPIDFPFSDGILVATPGGAAIRVAILLGVTLVAGYLPAKLIIRRNTLDAILGR